MTTGTVLNRPGSPLSKGHSPMARIRNLPTADLSTHTPWPQFPRANRPYRWVAAFRHQSRLVVMFGGSR